VVEDVAVVRTEKGGRVKVESGAEAAEKVAVGGRDNHAKIDLAKIDLAKTDAEGETEAGTADADKDAGKVADAEVVVKEAEAEAEEVLLVEIFLRSFRNPEVIETP